MKIMPIMASNVSITKNKTNTNYSVLAHANYADSVCFSGKENFLTRILNLIKPQKAPQQVSAVENKLFDQQLFLSKFEEFKGKDGFRIYTQSGELLHEQEPENYELPKNAIKQIKGNVILLSQESVINIPNLVSPWEHGATHLLSLAKDEKKCFIFTFPEYTQKALQKAQKVYDTIVEKVNLDIEQLAVTEALRTGKPVFFNGEDIAPTFEKNYLDYFTKELNIQKSEVALDK